MGNHDVAAVWQHSFESIEHSFGAADDFFLERGIGLVEPAGQSDSAGNGIDFGDDVTVVRQNEIRTDHSRQILANFFAPRELDQLFRFAGIEIARDPLRLFSFDAELIKLIARALKNEQAMAELVELS